MRHLRISPLILSEAEIEQMYLDVAKEAAEAPVPLYDNLSDEEMTELAAEDRR